MIDTGSYQATTDQTFCKSPTATAERKLSRFSKATQLISEQGSSDKSVSQSSFQWFRPNQTKKPEHSKAQGG